jgi:hypothetical protein
MASLQQRSEVRDRMSIDWDVIPPKKPASSKPIRRRR